jgi:hypothetical protein
MVVVPVVREILPEGCAPPIPPVVREILPDTPDALAAAEVKKAILPELRPDPVVKLIPPEVPVVLVTLPLWRVMAPELVLLPVPVSRLI